MRLTLSLLALFAVSAHAAPTPKNSIKNDWLALMANGCDLAKHQVYTSFEASVLRNTPYALAGYAFKSDGLRALFSADGGWYTPKSKSAPTFEPKVSACIAKIKAFEKTEKFKGNTGFKELMFKEYDTYVAIREHNKLFTGGVPTASIDSAATNGNWFATLECPKCTGLQTYQLMCSAAQGCELVVPGDGSIRVE
jgi:hypothetical protein